MHNRLESCPFGLKWPDSMISLNVLYMAAGYNNNFNKAKIIKNIMYDTLYIIHIKKNIVISVYLLIQKQFA